jgi:hypothetical protein
MLQRSDRSASASSSYQSAKVQTVSFNSLQMGSKEVPVKFVWAVRYIIGRQAISDGKQCGTSINGKEEWPRNHPFHPILTSKTPPTTLNLLSYHG